MSKLSLAPNYCSCTVKQARNLPNKGKNGGVDPFCTISMGKDKFITAICQNTTSPVWHEQCEMAIADDAKIKLTVYHNTKSSLSKGDFIGRTYVSLRDLQDYDQIHTNWYKLSNKDGKFDKERGEIEVSLQFYSKNNTTGSVLDLATKRKHLSLKDIRHSLSDKLKTATRQRKQDKYSGDNQLHDQSHRLSIDGGSTYNVRDFLDDSTSETTSFTGSHMSLNSMTYNTNVEQQRKKSRALGVGNGTPHSSRRSITSDYETSSILDSASMYGGDESLTPSPSVRTKNQQQNEIHFEIETNKKKTKDNNEKSSIKQNKENDMTTTLDSSFGLSTIKENLDTDEYNLNSTTSSKYQNTIGKDLDNYFNKIKQTNQEIINHQTNESKYQTYSQSDDIQTPSISIVTKNNDNTLISLSTFHDKKQSNETHDSTDDDVDEILGKLERASSMRSSVRRKIQPKDDIMQQSLTENENKFFNSHNQTPINRNRNAILPDIVGEPTTKNSSTSGTKKPSKNGLCVLGYENVKSASINQQIRQELDYLDREELLHVIAYQTDLLKKRDTRVKDLENYTDGLLVKIVEQCPSILQIGSSSKR